MIKTSNMNFNKFYKRIIPSTNTMTNGVSPSIAGEFNFVSVVNNNGV